MNHLLNSLRVLALFTLLTGLAYPALVTVVAQTAFPRQARGSLIIVEGRVLGSELLAQCFLDPSWFWSRPSAGDDGTRFGTVPSAASNLGPTSGRLREAIQSRERILREAPVTADSTPLPAELLLASGSGLDPHLSPEAVRWQISRVARARGLNPERVRELEQLVERCIEPPQFGIFGPPRVNVLRLNRALSTDVPSIP